MRLATIALLAAAATSVAAQTNSTGQVVPGVPAPSTSFPETSTSPSQTPSAPNPRCSSGSAASGDAGTCSRGRVANHASGGGRDIIWRQHRAARGHATATREPAATHDYPAKCHSFPDG